MTPSAIGDSPPRQRSSGFVRWAVVLLLAVLAGAALWTWLTMVWEYADGERAGVLQKFVRRGWLCKTREGEIALYYGGGQYMGSSLSPQLWDFSVRNPAVAADLTKAVGHRVQLHYTEHPGIPTSCLGETRYFVDRVTITDNEPGPGGIPAPAGSPRPAGPPTGPAATPGTNTPAGTSPTTGSPAPAPPGAGSTP